MSKPMTREVLATMRPEINDPTSRDYIPPKPTNIELAEFAAIFFGPVEKEYESTIAQNCTNL